MAQAAWVKLDFYLTEKLCVNLCEKMFPKLAKPA
jgi:hypothetical protein